MFPLCRPHLSPPKVSFPARHSTPNNPPLAPSKPLNSPSIFEKLGRTKTRLLQSSSKEPIFRDPHNVKKPASTESFLDEPVKLSSGSSRRTLLCAISIGFAVALMGFEEKALALGPEGPLMEEFWDNMRRYSLYALTVSTGAIYTIMQPILELLKNPLSALLIIAIIGGSGLLVYQVLSAMVGISDFSYEYGN